MDRSDPAPDPTVDAESDHPKAPATHSHTTHTDATDTAASISDITTEAVGRGHDHDGWPQRPDLDTGEPRPNLPCVTVSSVSDALDWYVHVFDVEICAVTDIDDKMVHAEVSFSQGNIQLRDADLTPHLENNALPISASRAVTVTCTQIDVIVARAGDRSATLDRINLGDNSGFTQACFQDPFGIQWTLTTRRTPLVLRQR